MDNLFFKRLPTDKLPTATGQNAAIVMSNSGVLHVITADGAEEIVRVDRLEPLMERLAALEERLAALEVEDNETVSELAGRVPALEEQIATLLSRIEALEAKSHKHKVIK